ncbi:hypothetical protein BS17DRAFT_785902 [Gyrodon lividus]|nr:hypothetical protein BS17DRAFT_785902 [Gyrodon lividus]
MNRDRNTTAVPANEGEGSAGPQNPAVVQPVPSFLVGAGTFHSEHIPIIAPDPGNSANAGDLDAHPRSSSTPDRHPGASEGFSTFPRSQDNPYADFDRVPGPPPPARSRDGQPRGLSRRATGSPQAGPNTSGIDWIVPVEEKGHVRRTIGERLEPTIQHAVIERDKYAKKALWTGYALNIAIGLQVLLGALTTGLSAAVSSARQAQIATSLLGGASTMVASYLARARGSNEPELSITRVKDLEQFLRESRSFQMDHAHEYGTAENGLDRRLEDLRLRFEALLGNANGERRLSPVGVGS